MSIKVHPMIAGSNAPLEVQFIDAITDAGLSLTGCTGFSAVAKRCEEMAERINQLIKRLKDDR